ncbi:MAG: hypothetical protein ACRYF3_00130 [Janthinobacterium lividum]
MAKAADYAMTNGSNDVPGVRLGLPVSGRGSVAGWGRRFLGLLVDWIVASLIARAFLVDALGTQIAPLAVFFVMHVLLVSTLGMSLGHAATGIIVRRLGGGVVGFGRGIPRTILLILVIPAVITDPDRRGLHDRASDTIVVRR